MNIVDPSDVNTWKIVTFAGSKDESKHVDGSLSDARFINPAGMYYDRDFDELLVLDQGSKTLRKINISTQQVSTIYGEIGVAASFLGYLNKPEAVVIGADKSIFISDSGNNEIVKLSVSGDASVILGTGEQVSSGDGAPAFVFPVDQPRGITFDSYGNLLVTSSKTLRMLIANDSGDVGAFSEVITLYGRTPRIKFPENVTRCLSGVQVYLDNKILITDQCQGYVIELNRVATSSF